MFHVSLSQLDYSLLEGLKACLSLAKFYLTHGGDGLVTKSCTTLATPQTIACQAPLSMGSLQARILEWVVIPFSRGSSRPRN